MIMLDILFPFNLLFWEISRNSLVGDELLPNDPFLSSPFRIPVKEPPAKNNVKIACLTNIDRPYPELTG